METFVFCIISSAIISIVIGNIVGIYYLNKLDREWKEIFDKVTEVTIHEIKRYMHR